MEQLCCIREYSVSENLIDEVHKRKVISLEGEDLILTQGVSANSYLVLRDIATSKKTALCKVKDSKTLTRVNLKKLDNFCGIKPKDSKQAAFVDSLLDPNIVISTAIGPAGTGKTTLALAYALTMYQEEKKPIYLTKSTVLVGRGKAFGPVPGDVQDKFSPHISSYKIVLKKLLGENSPNYISMLESKKNVEYIPIEYTRGCTFEDCTFILDEVQNLTWHELKTVASRMGQNTKLILLGDPDQIDTKMSVQNTGIAQMLQSKTYRGSCITSSIYLTQQYRGPIPQLISSVDKEVD
jgi:PhoH-like ATPase